VARLSFDQICRRAGGRRRYNLQREIAKDARRKKVERLLNEYGPKAWGVNARIAHELGVSEATISRDAQSIRLRNWVLENPGKVLRLWYGNSWG
jgi:hypothetical protein